MLIKQNILLDISPEVDHWINCFGQKLVYTQIKKYTS